MGTIEAYILGQKYTIRGDAPDEHIEKLVAYVNSKIQEVYKNAPNTAPLKASILAAIDIADELYRLRDEQEIIARGIEDKANALTGLFD
ncbi:MAG TPA: cell division protein ZapA [Thermodesulfovibrionales bacterium]|nr:cell division protein ZapA [Thermodesulfovibrionales bacterium]